MKITELRDGFNCDDSDLIASFQKMQAEVEKIRELLRKLAADAKRERLLADGYLQCGR